MNHDLKLTKKLMASLAGVALIPSLSSCNSTSGSRERPVGSQGTIYQCVNAKIIEKSFEDGEYIMLRVEKYKETDSGAKQAEVESVLVDGLGTKYSHRYDLNHNRADISPPDNAVQLGVEARIGKTDIACPTIYRKLK